MRVIVRKKNLEMTPELTNYIDDKIVRPLERFLARQKFSEFAVLNLAIGRSTLHHRKGKIYQGKADLKHKKGVLHAEAESENPRSVCDLLKEELEKEIVVRKNRSFSLEKRKSRSAKQVLRFDAAARMPARKGGRTINEGI